MKIQTKIAVKMNGKSHKPGVHHVLDKLAHTQGFKKLVQAGHVVVMPRDEKEQKALHSKNEQAAQAAVETYQKTHKPEPKAAVQAKAPEIEKEE